MAEPRYDLVVNDDAKPVVALQAHCCQMLSMANVLVAIGQFKTMTRKLVRHESHCVPELIAGGKDATGLGYVSRWLRLTQGGQDEWL